MKAFVFSAIAISVRAAPGISMAPASHSDPIVVTPSGPVCICLDFEEVSQTFRHHHHAHSFNDQKLQVQGFMLNDTRVFRGIPYAAPPLDDLRYRPPQVGGLKKDECKIYLAPCT